MTPQCGILSRNTSSPKSLSSVISRAFCRTANAQDIFVCYGRLLLYNGVNAEALLPQELHNCKIHTFVGNDVHGSGDSENKVVSDAVQGKEEAGGNVFAGDTRVGSEQVFGGFAQREFL